MILPPPSLGRIKNPLGSISPLIKGWTSGMLGPPCLLLSDLSHTLRAKKVKQLADGYVHMYALIASRNSPLNFHHQEWRCTATARSHELVPVSWGHRAKDATKINLNRRTQYLRNKVLFSSEVLKKQQFLPACREAQLCHCYPQAEHSPLPWNGNRVATMGDP